MSEAAWWRHLRADPTAFLLDEREPGVVHRVLVELLDRPWDSPAVARARAAARELGTAAAILDRQGPLGYWGSPGTYGARWSGGVWHLLAAARLGADPQDPRSIRGGETLLRQLEPRHGGFAVARNRPPSPCFTGEVCAGLTRLGFGRHPRVAEAVGWLISRSSGSGGWSCPELRHTVDGACPVAAVAVLDLAAEVPIAERERLAPAVDRAAGWLVARHLLLLPGAPSGWRRFTHPCLARADLLAALTAMARLGLDPCAALLDGVREVLHQQGRDGCWRPGLASPFGEKPGYPSRWLTLKALVVLGAWGQLVDREEVL